VGDGSLVKVELVFNRNQLALNAGEVESRIQNRFNKLGFPQAFEIKGVTVMSRWLVVLVDFPALEKHPPETELIFDAIAGEIVRELADDAVRYRHFTVVGERESLIFKEKIHA